MVISSCDCLLLGMQMNAAPCEFGLKAICIIVSCVLSIKILARVRKKYVIKSGY
jgi:hypothetical protein